MDNDQSKLELAYNAIKDSIIKEEYAPNQMISTRTLCAVLGVSRTPVMEALKKLSYEGFVELIPNRGVTVSAIKAYELLEIYQLREGVEGIAARMCALNHPDDIIARMGQCLDAVAEATRDGHIGKAISLDNQFHILLIAGSGNERMMQFMEAILHQSGRGNFLQGTAAQRMKRSAVQHRNILMAIKKRDAEMAEKYAREHMRDVQNFVLNYQKSHEIR